MRLPLIGLNASGAGASSKPVERIKSIASTRARKRLSYPGILDILHARKD